MRELRARARSRADWPQIDARCGRARLVQEAAEGIPRVDWTPHAVCCTRMLHAARLHAVRTVYSPVMAARMATTSAPTQMPPEPRITSEYLAG